MDNRPIDQTTAIAVTTEAAEDAHLTEFSWYILLVVVSLWGISILTFGLPGLVVPALVLLPFVFTALMLITVGG